MVAAITPVAPAAAAIAQKPADAEDQELAALVARYNSLKVEIAAIDKRYIELEKIELEQMADAPTALNRRKADARLFRDTDHRLRHPSVGIGYPYEHKEVELFRRRKAMRNRYVGKIDTPEFMVVREPWPLAQARADAIVAARRNGTASATSCGSGSDSSNSTSGSTRPWTR